MASMIRKLINKLLGRYIINGVYIGERHYEIFQRTKIELEEVYASYSIEQILQEANRYRTIASSTERAKKTTMADEERASNENANMIATTYALCLSQIGREKLAERYTYIRQP